ncbi:DHHA2 domain-containing protein [Cerasicoccus frondis]|uniref:DHHA2 domain-containing protein n=1 Tax=Cerasicoccus frondis TaxID=490090 RepID=UPI0028525D3A|nr:DHHA2 domain-containing protein [Cerasicoccus frondis]
MNNLYVTGHKNPDTDSLVSAHVFAWMLGQESGAPPGLPLRLGEPNPQSAWLFAEAGEPLPELREDCRPTILEACVSAPTISPNAPLSAALRLLRESHSPLVVVTDEHGIQGIISERMPRVTYLLSANVEDMLGTLLQWEHLVQSLPLKPVNHTPLRSEPTGMKFISGAPATANDILVTGPMPENPQALLDQKPAAIIIVGPIHCPALEEQTDVPVFAYHGSAFAFCASLGGCIPCCNALETKFVTIHADEILSECRGFIADTEFGLLVIDDAGQLCGLVTPQQLVAAPRPKVALVDHFERAQSIRGLEEAEILAIIDHHRIGDIETSEPVDIDCRIWGSTASILFARCRESGLAVPPSKAKLLLGALISDTLLLQSPTTREQDRRIANELAAIAGVDLQTFGLDVLRHNDHLLTAKASSLVRADCKAFTHGKRHFLAAQIETVDLAALSDERARELEASLEAQLALEDFAMLMITDVLKQVSRISVLCHDPIWRRKLIPQNAETINGHVWLAEGFVSRKKQLIPYVLSQLNS